MAKRRLEVHEHSFIFGPRSTLAGSRLVHSLEGGDVQHKHPDTGMASSTIDKDEWMQRTGLKGGGRKKFTASPSGEQHPLIGVPLLWQHRSTLDVKKFFA